MEDELKEKVEQALARLSRMLGGAEVRLEGIEGGVVTVRYFRPLANPSACHVSAAGDEDLAQEALQDVLKEVVPDFKGIRLVGGEG